SALSLDGPVHNLTVRTGGIEPQEAMRIAPEPFGDRSLHRDFLSDVELRSTVMCEQRNRDDQEAKSDGESPRKLISHCDASAINAFKSRRAKSTRRELRRQSVGLIRTHSTIT